MLADFLQLVKSTQSTKPDSKVETKIIAELSILRSKILALSVTSSPSQADLPTEILELLFTTQFALNQLGNRDKNEELELAIERFNERVQHIAEKEGNAENLNSLVNSLDGLSYLLSSINNRYEKRQKVSRRILFAAACLPFLGYGMYYLQSTFLTNIILLDKQIISPAGMYELVDGTFSIKPKLQKSAVEAFAPSYYGDFIEHTEPYNDSRIYLPNYFPEHPQNQFQNSDYEEEYGFNKVIENNLKAFPRLKDISLREQNFTHLRMFLKNIRKNQVFDGLSVELSRAEDNPFPWYLLPVKPELEVRLVPHTFQSFLKPPHIYVRVYQAPVTNISYTFEAKNVKQESLSVASNHTSEHLDGFSNYELQFDNPVFDEGAYSGMRYFIKLTGDLAEKYDSVALSPPTKPEELDKIAKDYKAELFFRCKDQSIVYLAHFEQMVKKLNPTKIAKIEGVVKAYDISGKEHKFSYSFDSEKDQLWSFGEDVSIDAEQIKACLSEDTIAALSSDVPVELIPTSGQRVIHYSALALMGSGKIPQSSIKTQLALLLANADSYQISAQHLDTPLVLNDGDIIQVDIGLAGLAAGQYKLKLLVDNQLVDEIKLNLFWPEELSYDPESFKQNLLNLHDG